MWRGTPLGWSCVVTLAIRGARTDDATYTTPHTTAASFFRAAFVATACSGNATACDAPFADGDQHEEAAQAVLQHKAEYLLDCRENCSQQGLVAKPLGISFHHGLYTQKWFLDANPGLRHIETWRRAALLFGPDAQAQVVDIEGQEVSVLGFPSGSNSRPLFEFFSSLGFDALSNALQTPLSGTVWADTLVASLHARVPILCVLQRPSLFASVPDYGLVPLEVPASWYGYYPNITVMKVRREDHPIDGLTAAFDGYTMTNTLVVNMLKDLVTKFSPFLPEDDVAFRQALTHVAKTQVCKAGGRSCGQGGWDTWPREKGRSLPRTLQVMVKRCDGFVNILDPALLTAGGACNASMPANFDSVGLRPGIHIDGFTVRHILQLFRNLGYRESDVVFRCLPATYDVLHIVGKGLADMGAACITITSGRQDLVDFTTPTYATSVAVAFEVVEEMNLLGLLQPFSYNVWLVIVAGFVATGVAVFLFEGRWEMVNLRYASTRILGFCNFADEAASAQPVASVDDDSFRGISPMSMAASVLSTVPAARGSSYSAGTAATSCVSQSSRVGPLRSPVRLVGKVATQASLKFMDALLMVAAGVGLEGKGNTLKRPVSRLAVRVAMALRTVLLALYTAQLASYLTRRSTGQISSVRDLISKRIGVASETCQAQCGAQRCMVIGRIDGIRRHTVEEYVDDIMNGGGQHRYCITPDDLLPALREGFVDAVAGDMPSLMVQARRWQEAGFPNSLGILPVMGQEFGYVLHKGSSLHLAASEAAAWLNLNTDLRATLDAAFFLKVAPATRAETPTGLTELNMAGLFGAYGCILLVLAACTACGSLRRRYGAWRRRLASSSRYVVSGGTESHRQRPPCDADSPGPREETWMRWISSSKYMVPGGTESHRRPRDAEPPSLREEEDCN